MPKIPSLLILVYLLLLDNFNKVTSLNLLDVNAFVFSFSFLFSVVYYSYFCYKSKTHWNIEFIKWVQLNSQNLNHIAVNWASTIFDTWNKVSANKCRVNRYVNIILSRNTEMIFSLIVVVFLIAVIFILMSTVNFIDLPCFHSCLIHWYWKT